MSIKVVELFAGVGGFRIGLEHASTDYKVVWSNQWEPSTKKQHACLVYQNRWPKANHSNQNIEEVIESDFDQIPNHDLLVGGFPCQDYSVATTLRNSKGLRGKKGVLWWSIEAILRKKGADKPKYLMLENVDRLLISPANQRGRDFAIMLSSLNALDYAVEWRVINAADYGMPQRRKRVFILAYHKSSSIYKKLVAEKNKLNWLETESVIVSEFPVKPLANKPVIGTIDSDIQAVSDSFNSEAGKSPFMNTGVMINGEFVSVKTECNYNRERTFLKDILVDSKKVPSEFFIDESALKAKNGWAFQKGGKKIERTNSQGFKYTFSEGSMTFPDALDAPSRTIVTGEGGPSPSRFKHVILQNGRYRRLLPIELERLNMFPDNHTKLDGISDSKRAFFMGNALVVGVVEKLGRQLALRIEAVTPQRSEE